MTKKFTPELKNTSSPAFKSLKKDVEDNLGREIKKNMPAVDKIDVYQFRSKWLQWVNMQHNRDAVRQGFAFLLKQEWNADFYLLLLCWYRPSLLETSAVSNFANANGQRFHGDKIMWAKEILAKFSNILGNSDHISVIFNQYLVNDLNNKLSRV